MTYEPFDVVVVPFPFTDSSRTKRRPALVLSQKTGFGDVIEHSVLAMITSQKMNHGHWMSQLRIKTIWVSSSFYCKNEIIYTR